MRIESGDVSVVANRWNSTLLVAAGTNPYDLVDAAVTAAAEMSGGHRKPQCGLQPSSASRRCKPQVPHAVYFSSLPSALQAGQNHVHPSSCQNP